MFGSSEFSHDTYFSLTPGSLWLNVLADSLIALMCFLIPVALIRTLRKGERIPLEGAVFCFVAFIVACGVTHATEAATVWHPVYGLTGGLKACTAAIAVAALILLSKIRPKVPAIPLELADRRFQELIEDAPDAIVQVDAGGTIVIANRTAEQIFGYSRDELLGSNVDLLVPTANRTRHSDHRERFMQSGVTRPMGKGMDDLHARRKDGTEFSVEIALSPVKTETGVHSTAVIRDVTDRKRLERELEEERAQRNQRIEILARLSSGLAHEIKNPLAIIHARASDLSEMASEGDVDRVYIEKACASIVQTSDRAIRILRGVAAMARVGAHDPMQRTSMREVVEQAVDLVRGRYMTSGILLDTDFPLGLPMVECREVQISQVLVNLLNNAFDAVDGDSRSERWVRIQLSTRPSVEYEDQMERLQIEVVDGGPGVAAEHKDLLMQTFFTTKPLGAGIGIGLSVSRTIAEDHGGQLELRDCRGHTCFRLTLPVHVEERSELTV